MRGWSQCGEGGEHFQAPEYLLVCPVSQPNIGRDAGQTRKYRDSPDKIGMSGHPTSCSVKWLLLVIKHKGGWQQCSEILFDAHDLDSHLHGFLFASSTPDYVPKEKRINISWNRGTMNVRNLSIPIYCDGFYLVSLKGTIRATYQRNASLSLKVYKRSDASILCVKVTEEVVDSVTVSEMRFKDEVYLEANRDANYKDLTLGLFLLTPRSHCLPDAYKM
uniref:Uncharacterized protein n=1 Tax=Chrysemys picta bellii TaxID=8478 RepID=A0A8C3FBT1_CHRPI